MAGIAIIALLGMPTAAVAVDSNAVQHLKHYIDCLGWLLTDLPTHETNCTPSRQFQFPEQPGSGGGDGLPTVIRLLSPKAWSDEAPPSSQAPSSSESEEPSCPNTEGCPPDPCIEDPYSCFPV